MRTLSSILNLKKTHNYTFHNNNNHSHSKPTQTSHPSPNPTDTLPDRKQPRLLEFLITSIRGEKKQASDRLPQTQPSQNDPQGLGKLSSFPHVLPAFIVAMMCAITETRVRRRPYWPLGANNANPSVHSRKQPRKGKKWPSASVEKP